MGGVNALHVFGLLEIFILTKTYCESYTVVDTFA